MKIGDLCPAVDETERFCALNFTNRLPVPATMTNLCLKLRPAEDETERFLRTHFLKNHVAPATVTNLCLKLRPAEDETERFLRSTKNNVEESKFFGVLFCKKMPEFLPAETIGNHLKKVKKYAKKIAKNACPFYTLMV